MNSKPKLCGALLVALPLLGLTWGPIAHASSPKRVNLLTAANFEILSETGITDVPPSAVTGAVGVSPITGAANLLTCPEITGGVLSVDLAGPMPCSIKRPTTLAKAVLDMQTAYADAAGRIPDVTELGAGNIGGLTIAPGVYKWSTNVLVPTNVTLKGTSGDVWIFQIAQDLTVDSGTAIILGGNARAKNVFWQVAGAVTIGTAANFEGNILSKTLIAMQTGASVYGHLLAQTAVTLEMNVAHYPPQ